MFHYFDTITNTKGDALPGWQIECVQLSDGSTVVPIYADESRTPILTVSGVANRAVADEYGNFDFYVDSGTYSLRFYNAEGVYQRLQRYLSMYGNVSEIIAKVGSEAVIASRDILAAVVAPTDGQVAFVTENGTVTPYIFDSASHRTALLMRSLACTATAATDTFTFANHYMETGSSVWCDTTTHGLTAKTLYIVTKTATNAFKLSTSHANAIAGVYVNVTAGGAITLIHGGDSTGGVYLVPNGQPCDGSTGAWIAAPAGGRWNVETALVTGYAGQQGVISSFLNLIPDGSTAVFPAGTIEITRRINIRYRSGIVIEFNPLTHLHGDGSASSGIVYHTAPVKCRGNGGRISNFRGTETKEGYSEEVEMGEAAGILVLPPLGSTEFDGVDIDGFVIDGFDNGITTQAQFKYVAGTPHLTTTVTPITNVKLTNNTINVARNGLEIFGNDGAVAYGNKITINGDVIGSSQIKRAIRLVGTVNFDVYGNDLTGYDESNIETYGVDVGPAGYSDYPEGDRRTGFGKIHHNTYRGFNIHNIVMAARGTVDISDNHAYAKDGSALTAGTSFIRRADTATIEGTLGHNNVTITNATPGVVQWRSNPHILASLVQQVRLYTTGALPSPLVAGTLYYVVSLNVLNASDANFSLSLTSGGAAIATTTAGSGTHHVIFEEYAAIKNRSVVLNARDNTVIGLTYFQQEAGRSFAGVTESNFHIGNSHASSRFLLRDNFNDVPGLEFSAYLRIAGNRGIYNPSSTGSPISFGGGGTKTGEVVSIGDNDFAWPTGSPPVDDGGTGTVQFDSMNCVKRLDTALWTNWRADWSDTNGIGV